MFERYNEKARRVIYHSRQFASDLGSVFIEPEHVLLAILEEDPGLVHGSFEHDGIAALREEVTMAGRGPNAASLSIDMALSASAKRVLAYGAEEAERLNHKEIRPAHLLAGVLREHDSPAAGLLRRHGIERQTSLVFVASSQSSPAFDGEAEELHQLVDELPASQWGRARAILLALRDAPEQTR